MLTEKYSIAYQILEHLLSSDEIGVLEKEIIIDYFKVLHWYYWYADKNLETSSTAHYWYAKDIARDPMDLGPKEIFVRTVRGFSTQSFRLSGFLFHKFVKYLGDSSQPTNSNERRITTSASVQVDQLPVRLNEVSIEQKFYHWDFFFSHKSGAKNKQFILTESEINLYDDETMNCDSDSDTEAKDAEGDQIVNHLLFGAS